MQNRPYIIGTLVGNRPLERQIWRAKKAPVDILEIRLDSFALNTPFISLVHTVKKKFRKPVLLTFRSADEGGLKTLSEENRFVLLKPLLNFSDWVDIEIQSAHLARKLGPVARRKRKKIIHSYHHFSKIPPTPFLNQLKKKSRLLKGDFLKVAVKPKSENDLMRFLKWGMTCHKNPILIGMGRHGRPSRFLGYSFGSQAAFGHLGQSAAPGQPSAGEAVKTIREIYG